MPITRRGKGRAVLQRNTDGHAQTGTRGSTRAATRQNTRESVAPPISPRDERRQRRASALASSRAATATTTTSSDALAAATATTVPSLRRIEEGGVLEGAASACDADLGEGGSDVEGEDNTVWFYNRCASSAANVNSTTLEVSTQFMRFLKSAFHGKEPGVEFMRSADLSQNLQIDMLKDPSLFVFSQADDLLVRDISNRALRLLNTPDFDEQTLQAINHLKEFRENIDAEDLSFADEDDIGVALLKSPEYDTTSDVSSYHPSDSNDVDSDLDTKPAARKKSPRKGEKKMGADVGVAKKKSSLQKITTMQFFRMTRSLRTYRTTNRQLKERREGHCVMEVRKSLTHQA